MLPVRMPLYEMAYIHRSASVVMPDGNHINNERLEYLGDAILNAVVADFLFRRYPGKNEGFLTKMRSKIVKRKYLDVLALRLGIDRFMTSQPGLQEKSKHLYGNAFEALLGAIYLDKGYSKTAKYIEKIICRYLDLEKLLNTDQDYKSQLIEWAQKNKKEIVFESREELKAENNMPVFIVHVKLSDKDLGQGTGNSKKDAEQRAAKAALGNISFAGI